MAAKSNNDIELEARLQRLSLVQGVFAERRLFPAASDDHRMLATDIDVLGSEYTANFHLTRSHFECKSGKKTQILDRVLWLAGVRRLLDADASYLVVANADEEAGDFASRLQVDIITERELTKAELSLHIAPDDWPGRSDYSVLEPARAKWRNHYQQKTVSNEWALLKSAFSFLDVDGWMSFEYRHLNRLFRLLDDVSLQLKKGDGNTHEVLCRAFILNALAIRLSQYLLNICRDTNRVSSTELDEYIQNKLVFGDNNPRQAMGLIEGTLNLVNKALQDTGKGQHGVDTKRLVVAPAYTGDFIQLVTKLRESPGAARFLPLALEMVLFDDGSTCRKYRQLKHAVDECEELCGLVRGFLIRSFAIPSDALASCIEALSREYGAS